MTTIHCLVIYDDTKDKIYTFDPTTSRSIEDGLRMLQEAEVICGHNILTYDIPVIKKLCPWWTYKKAIDTIVIARVIYPDIKSTDYDLFKSGRLPVKLIGRHSLESWGYRLGEFKGDYGERENAWETWTPEMTEYCVQDVNVTWKLYSRLSKFDLSNYWFYLEHRVAEIIAQQEINGFLFDAEYADEVVAKLRIRRAEILHELQKVFPPWYAPEHWDEQDDGSRIGRVFTPKKDNKARGYYQGCPMTKVGKIEFNPGSRQHIAYVLQRRFGWEPTLYTEKSGEAVINDEVLSELPWPGAKLIGEYMMVAKRLGQVADGDQAWLKHINPNTGRIHGGVNTNGAVTGRMTHFNPNVAQAPSVEVPWGTECRSMWHVPKGYKQVGCDASGLEARCLSHYLWRYDNGEYIDTVLNGNKAEGTDVHGRNMKALGLGKPEAKRWFYAWMYGAGDDLLGAIAGGNKKLGARLRKKFLKAMPAIAKLIEAVQEKARTLKYVRGLDGRIVPCRSQHSALNTVLQGAGAIIMKQALVMCHDELTKAGIDFKFVANIHDEFQMEVREDQAELAGQIARQSIVDAGIFFKFRCPLDGEFKIGNNWAETH